jgi:hypothetical protein
MDGKLMIARMLIDIHIANKRNQLAKITLRKKRAAAPTGVAPTQRPTKILY